MDKPEVPAPPAEGQLIKRAREARGLSLEEASRRCVDQFGGRMSATRWSQLESGYRMRGGQPQPERASDARLAHMAYVVRSAPNQLADIGKDEAADILQEIIRQSGPGEDDTTERLQRARREVSQLRAGFEDAVDRLRKLESELGNEGQSQTAG